MHKVGLLIVFGCALALFGGEIPVQWTDHFDSLEKSRWEVLPECANIGPLDTLTASNRVLVLAPPKGERFLASKDKFLGGDCEIRFKAEMGENRYYYLGFHNYRPWLKAICWIMIWKNSATLVVKTPENVKLVREIARLDPQTYHTIAISQSTGKLKVQVDNQQIELNEKYISKEPMPLFLGANGLKGDPAVLKVDYVKVSGGQQPNPFHPKSMSSAETSLLMRYPDRKAVMNSGGFKMVFDFNGGLHWGDMELQKTPLIDEKGFVPCFAAIIDGRTVFSHQFILSKITTGVSSITIQLEDSVSGVVLDLEAEKTLPQGIRLNLKCMNRSENERKVQLIFPIAGSFAIGGNQDTTEYFFPWRGGIFGRENASFAAEYGGLCWTQLMFVYDRKSRDGLYIYPEDFTGRFKGCLFEKISSGLPAKVSQMDVVVPDHFPNLDFSGLSRRMIMSYYDRIETLRPGASTTAPAYLFVAWNGSWKVPMRNYAAWMNARLKPVVVPRWFRDTFTWWNWHPHLYYDRERQQYCAADRASGGDDALQLAFWDNYVEQPKNRSMSMLERYQFGDFELNRSRGGVVPFAAEVSRIHAKGVRCTLYIDYRFCWKNTQTARNHAKEWAVMDKNGRYPGYLSSDDQYLMCFYGTENWVRYIRDTAIRLLKTTGIDGIYLDELCIAYPCFNPQHLHVREGHFPTDSEGLGKALTTVRNGMKTVNPDAALMTEHAGSDYLSQFFDGSWDQTFYIGTFDFSEKYYDEYKLCYFRFMFPHFKLAEWGPSRLHAKRCLFNGMGIDLGAAPDVEEMRIYGTVMKENGDAFTTFTPEPIVPTTTEKLLANRFDAPGKLIFTLFNPGKNVIRGGIIEKTPFPGHYVELIRDDNVLSDKNGAPVLEVGPEEVAVLALYPVLLRAGKNGDKYQLSFPPKSGDKIIVCENNDDSHVPPPLGKNVSLDIAQGQAEYSPSTKAKKLIFKLLKNGYLVDELVVRNP